MSGEGNLLAAWRRLPATWQRGLSADEIIAIEKRFDFRFPPDLRRALEDRLPLGDSFPNWRKPETVVKQVEWPWEGIRFDIEYNNFWLPAWGSKPTRLDDALSVARRHFDQAPRLVPVDGHRYIPSQPHESGNPIFSVHQTDIIHYGSNIQDWVGREFERGGEVRDLSACRHIPFWTDIIEYEMNNPA